MISDRYINNKIFWCYKWEEKEMIDKNRMGWIIYGLICAMIGSYSTFLLAAYNTQVKTKQVEAITDSACERAVYPKIYGCRITLPEGGKTIWTLSEKQYEV